MKKYLILKKALFIIIGVMAFLVIMPFINFQEFNDTTFAMTNTDCDNCHGFSITKDKHHLYWRVQYDDACTMCHGPNYSYDDCVGCHTSGSTCTSTLSNHSDCKLAAHNNVSPDSTDCSSCHAANVVTEHNKYFSKYGILCGLCHQINIFFENQYNINPTVINAITKGSGISGQTVYCTSCHVTTNHTAQHDHAKIDSETCTQCHNSNVVTEHANRNLGCAVCHSSTNSKVISAINTGKGGVDVFCADCHGTAVDHETVHTKIVYAYPDPYNLVTSGCTVCHSPVALAEHSTYNVTCAACHNYSPYKEIIANAVSINSPAVTCVECHDGVDHSKTAHDTAKITYPGSDCTNCHSPSDAVTEHDKYNVDCYDCHTNNNLTKNNTNLTYQQVISNALKTNPNTPVSCTDCHGSTPDHTAAHTIITDTCASCHGGSLVTVHVSRGCSVCHNTTYQSIIDAGKTTPVSACSICHVGLDHTAAHATISDTCASCHGGSLVTVHVSRGCSVCHNTTYQQVINNGKITPLTSCSTSCHVGVNHTTAHNNKVVIPYADCGSCHATNVVTEHAKYNKTCSDCHNTTYQSVMSKSTVYCADCHVSFGNHSSQHNAIAALQTSCTSCHVGSYIALHENTAKNTHIYCLTCHTSQSALVATAIDNGMAGTSVQCSNCHATVCSYGNQSPVANAGPDQTVQTGQSVSFSGASSYDPDGSIVQYAWNFGDGSTGSGVTTSHTYTTTGTYTVTLTVTDNKGATGTDTAVITVQAQTSVYADQVLWIQNLSSTTNSDSSVSSSYRTDITTRFKDNILTDTFTIYNKSPYKVIAMKLNKDPGLYSQVIVRLYVKALYNNSPQTVKIYPYKSDGNSINTSYSSSYTINTTGWTQIDLTTLASRMKGFGWMKFRITCTSTSLDAAEGNFIVK